jgi:hypothetical protein
MDFAEQLSARFIQVLFSLKNHAGWDWPLIFARSFALSFREKAVLAKKMKLQIVRRKGTPKRMDEKVSHYPLIFPPSPSLREIFRALCFSEHSARIQWRIK